MSSNVMRSFGLNELINPITKHFIENAREMESTFYCGAGGRDGYWFKGIIPGENNDLKVVISMRQVPKDTVLYPEAAAAPA
jgi:hypothetical protein